MIFVLLLALGQPALGAPDLERPDPHASVRDDVRGTAASIGAILVGAREMEPSARDEVSASLAALVVDCPYTRVALELPFALERAAAEIPPEALDPSVRADWEVLEAGLSDHVAVLRAFGRDAPRQPGDLLEHSARQIAALPEDAARVDGPTLARIERLSDRVEALTGVIRPCPRGPWATLPGQPWTLGMQLAGWGDALRRLEPHVQGASQARIRAMREALDAYGDASLE